MSGAGWTRLAAAVAEQIPPVEVDGVWVFSPLRHEGREWGTAVLSRVDGDRRRIYTARYMLAVLTASGCRRFPEVRDRIPVLG